MFVSGFNAYHAYIITKKLYYESKKEVVSLRHNTKNLPIKSKLVKSWNEERRFKDGSLFQKICNKTNSIPELIQMFSVYYFDSPNFFVYDILEDDFSLYDRYLSESKNFDKILELDFFNLIEYCREHKMKFIDLLVGNDKGIPKLCCRDISILTLIFLANKFGVNKKIDCKKTNILTKEKAKHMKNVLPKAYSIFATPERIEIFSNFLKKMT